MGNKVLALLMVVSVAGVVLGNLWPSTPGNVDASGHSATRSFSSSSVNPGEKITVTIRADNYGGLGRIVETLPSGFTSPDASSPDASSPDASNQTVKLRLLQEGPQTRSYTVTASDNPGSYTFSGLLQSEDKSETQVLGPSSVTVAVSDSMTAVDPLIVRYDANSNGLIEKNEVIKAITDYLFGEGNPVISKSDVIKLINLYLFG